MKRILFVYNTPQPFVRTDLALIRQQWEVEEQYERSRRINVAAVIRNVRRCDLVFCWFASWHSLFPVLIARLFGKPSLVIIGGYDIANVPEAKYGSQRGGLRQIIARAVIKNASQLCTFSNSARQEASMNLGLDANRIDLIYLGLTPSSTPNFGNREPIVLTVGGVWRENLLRKGLLPFVQAATHIPDAKFILVGKWNDASITDLQRQATKNVEFTGFLADQDLAALFHRASVYVQASLHEGFGLSVAEAMLGGCIPVVTRNGSLPEVVGAAGFYAESNDPKEVACAIRQALNADTKLRLEAYNRILTLFPIEHRRQALYMLIEKLMSGNNENDQC